MEAVEAKPIYDFFEVTRHSIRTALDPSFDIDDPKVQIPQHICSGVKFLRENEDKTAEDITDDQIRQWMV